MDGRSSRACREKSVAGAGDGARVQTVMLIEAHQTRNPLSVAMSGLDPAAIGLPVRGRGARELIESIGRGVIRAVQLDLTMPGLRPRELDRSSRRDLAGLLRRVELGCSGFDVFLPPEHFLNSAHVDRAMSAVMGAIEFAGEFAGFSKGRETLGSAGRAIDPVCVRLPDGMPGTLLSALIACGHKWGVDIADFAACRRDVDGESAAMLVGLDTAEVVARGEEIAVEVAGAGPSLAAVRWTNVLRGMPGVRCEPGDARGSVGAAELGALLSITGFGGYVVVDVRGVAQTPGLLERAVSAWRGEMAG